MNPENDMRAIFSRALERVDPYEMIKNSIAVEDDTLVISHNGQTLRENLNAYRDIVAIGIGKASSKMGAAVEDILKERLSGGIVVTKYGHAERLKGIQVIEAGHPIPDENSVAGAEAIYRIASRADENTLIINLISGGGSSLLSLPAEGVTLGDKQETTRVLLESGADIREINCVRKHLSALKGGRLACACGPARLVNLLVSDVAGDDPSAIASGPGIPDPTTLDEARQVVEKYGLRASDAVHRHLADVANETPKPGCPCFASSSTVVLASSQDFLESAARVFEAEGVPAMILSASVEGESVDVALVHAAIARQVAAHGQPAPPPLVLLSGGETTVTRREPGRGGPNAEFLLALVLALGGEVEYAALACDTDGMDGGGGVAGAVARSDTLQRARAQGLEASRMLRANDSHAFFEALDDAVVTGPTFTNVNDLRAILVL